MDIVCVGGGDVQSLCVWWRGFPLQSVCVWGGDVETEFTLAEQR